MGDLLDWTGNNGIYIPFFGQTVFNGVPVYIVLERGKKGFEMAPIKDISDEIPGLPGEIRRETRVQARSLEVPLFIHCPGNQAVLRQFMRQLFRSFDPLNGDGILTVTATDGLKRQIACRYAAGAEGEDTDQSAGLTFRRRLIQFKAQSSPYFQDLTDNVSSFGVGTPQSFFPWGAADTMIRLSNSTVGGFSSINNPGDVEAWPIWTIIGPGSTIVITNYSQGQSIILSSVLTAGQIVTIDSRPGIRTIKDALNNDLYALNQVDSSTSLFSFLPGANTMYVQMLGATSASSVTASFRPQYWSA